MAINTTYALVLGYEWHDETYTENYEHIQKIKKRGHKLKYGDNFGKETIFYENNLFNSPTFAIFGKVIATSTLIDKQIESGSICPFSDISIADINEAKRILTNINWLSCEPKLIFIELDNNLVYTFEKE